MLLIQLAGAPGSGKSTLARELAKRYDAAVLDMDVVKSALLDADVPWQLAGKAGYGVLFALADDLLGNGRGVVIDSPSHYESIPARSRPACRLDIGEPRTWAITPDTVCQRDDMPQPDDAPPGRCISAAVGVLLRLERADGRRTRPRARGSRSLGTSPARMHGPV